MTGDKIEKNILKQGGLFRFIILLMLLSNVAYVSIDIYNFQISKPFLNKPGMTELEYSKIASLSHYESIFETTFIILSVICTFLIFTKKYKPLLKNYMLVQLIFLISILALNIVLSWIFDALVGNMTQLLFGPFVLLFGVFIYFVIESFSRKLKK